MTNSTKKSQSASEIPASVAVTGTAAGKGNFADFVAQHEAAIPNDVFIAVNGFTTQGKKRFSDFIVQHGKPGIVPERYALACCASLEAQINKHPFKPATWALPAEDAKSGPPPAVFTVEDRTADLLVDVIDL